MDGIQSQANGRPPVDPSAKGSIEGLLPVRGRHLGGAILPMEKTFPPEESSTFDQHRVRVVAHKG